MKRLKLLLGIILVVSVTGAWVACSSSNEVKNDNRVNHFIVIENMQFIPQQVTIRKGDTLTFVNKDIVAHNATEINGLWASPTLKPGDQWQFIPAHTTDYYCTIHVVMKGTVQVN